jgi:hypothetical protein
MSRTTSIGTEELPTNISFRSTLLEISHDAPLNGDVLPISFLQLQGISVGNLNMACNFHVYAALQIMIQYNLHILAIQEHTSWNRELTDGEVKSIHRHCDKWGYFATISKLQILIIDKQLLACHQNTTIIEDGHILKCHLEISMQNFATLVSAYGIPHPGGKKLHFLHREFQENSVLKKMSIIQDHIKKIIQLAQRNQDIVFIFGDLQDSLDN